MGHGMGHGMGFLLFVPGWMATCTLGSIIGLEFGIFDDDED